MADDSTYIVEPFDFHPCNSPRGMLYYDLKVPTIDQQVQLNLLKRDTIRENEKYLARHPEIRALIALITHHVLLYRPRTDLHEFISNFFSRPKPDIYDEMQQYIESREPHIYEGDSAVLIHEESSEGSTLTEEIEEEEVVDLEALPKEILDEILQKAYSRLGIDSDDMGDWRTTISPSGISVIKEVISEVIEKAMKEEREDVLQYLIKSQKDQHEESEAVECASYRPTDMSTDLLWATDLETEQDMLDDTILSKELLLATEELEGGSIEPPTEDSTQEQVDVPQTEDTVAMDPTPETIEDSTQEQVDEPQMEDTAAMVPTPETNTDVKQETEDPTLGITTESNLGTTNASELNESPTTDSETV